jgi:hypothetical protein
MTDAELTDTTHRSSLEELTNWVQWADRGWCSSKGPGACGLVEHCLPAMFGHWEASNGQPA